MALTQFRPT